MGKYATEGRKISTLPKIKNIAGKFVVQTEDAYKLVDVNTVKNLISGIKLIVNIPTGSSVTVSDREQTITKTAANDTVEFALPYFATWTIVATLDSDTVQKTININEVRVYEVNLRYEHIYGIRRDQNSSSPEWTRTDDAVGLTATPSIGNMAGSSDFDECYPWKDMKRVTLSTQTNGIQTMVWIPEFWYNRKVDNDGIETIQICDKNMTGFTKHPGSGCYVGAYLFGSGGKSITGVTPRNNIGIAGFRSEVSVNGDGWCLYNIAQVSAIQMLFLVEFATNNSQSVLGIGSHGGYKITGSCDNVPNLTGRPDGTNGSVDIVYRGIEGLWGNFWNTIDGINKYNNAYYVCTNPANFASDTATNYDTVSYTCPSTSGATYQYISKYGYDPNYPWVMLPSEASNGSDNTYYCDVFIMQSGWRTVYAGGVYAFTNLNYSGLFTFYMYNASTEYEQYDSSRIAYYPELDTNHNTIIYEGIGGES